MPPGAGPRPTAKQVELMAVCGLKAVQSLSLHRPQLVQRLFFDEATSRKFGPIAAELAKRKAVYRQVETSALESIAGTIHHGGVVAMIDPKAVEHPAPSDQDIAGWAKTSEPLLLLDCISDAHNLGAIVRTAAFFGLKRLVIPDNPRAVRPRSATWRVAQGGMSLMDIYVVPNMANFARSIDQVGGYKVVGSALSSRAQVLGASALEPSGRDKAIRPPIALVLGNEETGISRAVEESCTHLLRIPGAKDSVQSMNVSAAASVFMWHFFGGSVK